MTLRISGLRKAYGDTVALDGVGFELHDGELAGFLGPNGSGKTTTMRAIMRLVAPDAGDIIWDGHPIDDERRRRIGYMPEERGLYARMPVRQQIVFFARLAGVEPREANRRADEWLERFGLQDRAGDPVDDLSLGNQQRVQLAIALVHEPELLVLDEPFSGLDPLAVSAMRDVLAERASAGVGVLFSSHQLGLVEDLCRRAIIIDRGRVIAEGPIDELRAASPHRVLEISWSGDVPSWTPDGHGIASAPSAPGRSRFVTGTDVDLPAMVASAARAGRVAGFSFEPPQLDEVFSELVRSRAEAA